MEPNVRGIGRSLDEPFQPIGKRSLSIKILFAVGLFRVQKNHTQLGQIGEFIGHEADGIDAVPRAVDKASAIAGERLKRAVEQYGGRLTALVSGKDTVCPALNTAVQPVVGHIQRQPNGIFVNDRMAEFRFDPARQRDKIEAERTNSFRFFICCCNQIQVDPLPGGVLQIYHKNISLDGQKSLGNLVFL